MDPIVLSKKNTENSPTLVGSNMWVQPGVKVFNWVGTDLGSPWLLGSTELN